MKRSAAAAFALLLATLTAAAQDYPTHPITLIVPFRPAAASTRWRASSPTSSRMRLGTIVIDNRGGAGGVIGTRLAARAAPDGYTW